MIITTNLYMLSTIQLCMCFMERQESKIHRVTMIKCSTMLLAGLFYSVIILSNCWLWSVHCLQYILLNQRLTLESWDIITKNKHIPTDSQYYQLVINHPIDCQGMIIACFSTLSYPCFLCVFKKNQVTASCRKEPVVVRNHYPDDTCSSTFLLATLLGYLSYLIWR